MAKMHTMYLMLLRWTSCTWWKEWQQNSTSHVFSMSQRKYHLLVSLTPQRLHQDDRSLLWITNLARPSSNGSISVTQMTLIDVELKANNQFLLSRIQIGCFMCNDCNMTVLSQCLLWTHHTTPPPPAFFSKSLCKITKNGYWELCVCYLWMCVHNVLLLFGDECTELW